VAAQTQKQTQKRGAISRKRVLHRVPHDHDDPQLEALVREIIGRVADTFRLVWHLCRWP
jgi:predicted Zn-dependent protease